MSKYLKNNHYFRLTFKTSLRLITWRLWSHRNHFLNMAPFPLPPYIARFSFLALFIPLHYHSKSCLLFTPEFMELLFPQQLISSWFPTRWFLINPLQWQISTVEGHKKISRGWNSMDFYSQVSCFGLFAITDIVSRFFFWCSVPLMPRVRSWWLTQWLLGPKVFWFGVLGLGGWAGERVSILW